MIYTVNAYDEMWRPTETTDANGVSAYYTYDYLGNVLSATEGDGGDAITVDYTYDDNNRIETV